jgi:hypothetical protein
MVLTVSTDPVEQPVAASELVGCALYQVPPNSLESQCNVTSTWSGSAFGLCESSVYVRQIRYTRLQSWRHFLNWAATNLKMGVLMVSAILMILLRQTRYSDLAFVLEERMDVDRPLPLQRVHLWRTVADTCLDS